LFFNDIIYYSTRSVNSTYQGTVDSASS